MAKKGNSMRSHSDSSKNAIAYFSALALLFSYAEAVLPRAFPFFKIGLANAAMILALRSGKINFFKFMKLSLVKAVASSLMGGTLVTPFFLVSISQGVSSAAAMYFLFEVNRRLNKKFDKDFISAYGISVFGSAVSAFVQISLCALYLGNGAFSLLGAILIFNTLSGIATAFLETKISAKIPEPNPELHDDEFCNGKSKRKPIFSRQRILITGTAIFSAGVFFASDIRLLFAMFFFALAMQKLSNRKIKLIPHIFMWIFIFASTIPFPNGKIVFSILNFDLTKGSLESALQKSLRLSVVSSISQCLIAFSPPTNSVLSLALFHYKLLRAKFKNANGNIFERIKITFSDERP